MKMTTETYVAVLKGTYTFHCHINTTVINRTAEEYVMILKGTCIML